MSKDSDWIFDSIVGFLLSPSWSTPILTFIDQHCVIFDSEDENKLAYTDIHKKFVELVETLLQDHCKTLGITTEQFMQACQAGITNNDYSSAIFDQVLAVEDFLSFKKMMVKRNKELELEALALLQKAGYQLNLTPPPPSAAPLATAVSGTSTDDAELEEALRLSKEEMQRVLNEEEEDLKRALALSLQENEMLQQALQAEQAEIEHAIALSLALEEEKKRQLSLEHAPNIRATKARVDTVADVPRSTAAAEVVGTASVAASSSSTGTSTSTSLPSILSTKSQRPRSAREVPPEQRSAEAYLRQQKLIEEQKRAQQEAEAKSRLEADIAAKAQADEVAKQRKALMEAQKKKILEKKRAERERQLQEYNEKMKSTGKPAQSEASLASGDTRAALRRVLAQRMKYDVLDDEERRRQELAKEDLASIDEQLRRAEKHQEYLKKMQEEREFLRNQIRKEKEATK